MNFLHRYETNTQSGYQQLPIGWFWTNISTFIELIIIKKDKKFFENWFEKICKSIVIGNFKLVSLCLFTNSFFFFFSFKYYILFSITIKFSVTIDLQIFSNHIPISDLNKRDFFFSNFALHSKGHHFSITRIHIQILCNMNFGNLY